MFAEREKEKKSSKISLQEGVRSSGTFPYDHVAWRKRACSASEQLINGTRVKTPIQQNIAP